MNTTTSKESKRRITRQDWQKTISPRLTNERERVGKSRYAEKGGTHPQRLIQGRQGDDRKDNFCLGGRSQEAETTSKCMKLKKKRTSQYKKLDNTGALAKIGDRGVHISRRTRSGRKQYELGKIYIRGWRESLKSCKLDS